MKIIYFFLKEKAQRILKAKKEKKRKGNKQKNKPDPQDVQVRSLLAVPLVDT